MVPQRRAARPSQDSQTSRDDAHVPNDEYVRADFITRTEKLSMRRAHLRRASGDRTLADVHDLPTIGGDV